MKSDLRLEPHPSLANGALGSARRQLLVPELSWGPALELRRELHNQASKNARECRHVDSDLIESLNMDASEYEFPDEKLVLFFFNPFGSEVMTKVLGKLTASLDGHFRDVWVVLHDSTCAYLADQSPQLRFETARHGYRIYRSIPGRSVSDHVVRNRPPHEIGRHNLLD